jgi:hypothetical protein
MVDNAESTKTGQLTEKDKVAKRLVDWWFRIEPGIKEVYRFISPNEEAPNEPLKLLEVSDATFATGRVDVFGFAPDGDITSPVLAGTVTPNELELIQRGQIPLPSGWDMSTAELFVRPVKGRKKEYGGEP